MTRTHRLDRRHFLGTTATAAAGAGLALARSAAATAQGSSSPEASPSASPAASPVAATPDPNATWKTISVSRADALKAIRDHYKMEDPANKGGDVIQVFTTDIATLNPILAQDLAAGYILGIVYQGMVGLSPIDGSPVPALADSWEISSDGLRYRLHLNPDATWHDGQPVTAADVTATFDAILAKDSLAANSATIRSLLAAYTATDDHTVELTATDQIATFLEQVGTIAVMPKHIWEGVAYSDWPADPGSTGQDPKRVVGTGPFTFVEWVQGDHCTIARNDAYWLPDEIPAVDRYIYRVVGDGASALQAMQAGEVDVAGLSAAQAPSFIKDNPDLTITAFDTTHMYYYITNLDTAKVPFFGDVRVRQAMVWALDRDLVAKQIFNDYAVRADGTQPPVGPAYAPDQITSVYTYDPDKAKALLDEAGWAVGKDGIREKDGVRFTVEILYTNSSVQNQQLIPYMQQCWKEIGIELSGAAMPFPTMLERLNVGDFTMSLTGFSFTPDGNQGVMYRSDAMYPAGFNIARYSNPKYDELDSAQQRELDTARRRDLLIQASNILAADVPNVPIVFDQSVIASNPALHNFHPSGYFAASIWQLQWMWRDA